MFWPPTVAIFMELFFEGTLHRTLKQFTNIKRYILGKSYVCDRK